MRVERPSDGGRRPESTAQARPCEARAPPLDDRRPGPSAAHHIVQGQHFTTVALCDDCHQGSENGWHGRKVMWRIMKLDELGALNITLGRLKS